MELTSAYLTPPGEWTWNVTRVPSYPDDDTSPSSPTSVEVDHCRGFMIFFYTFVFGFLCLFGLTGNTVSILVLNRDRQNRVAVFLLQSLAVADNSVLCLSFVALSIFYGLHNVLDRQLSTDAKPIIIRYINPLGCAAQSSAVWITVLLAVNRYAAVCRPFASQGWLTVKLARIQVFVVVCFSVLLNIPRVFHDEIAAGTSFSAEVNRSSAPNCSRISSVDGAGCDPPTNRYFEAIYLNGFYTSVVLVLPLVLMVGFNVPLIRQLQASKRKMIRSSLSYGGQQENNITVVMVIIIIEMVVCHTPDRVVQVALFFNAEHHHSELKECPNALFYAIAIANCLVMLNSSTDFIVYYLFRKRFRKILCQRLRFCCCSGPDVGLHDPVAADGGFSSKGHYHHHHRPGDVGGGTGRTPGRPNNGTGSPLVRVNSNGSRQFEFKDVINGPVVNGGDSATPV